MVIFVHDRIKIAKEFANTIKSDDIKLIMLFGSVARGDDTEESDIDILIVSPIADKIKLRHEDFDLDAPLLKYNLNHVNHKFKKLNDYLGFGEVGGYARLRPHMLRKFNSTYLTQGSFEGDLLGMDSVDLLHGRGKNKTRQAYYKDNPDFLKLEYIKAMSNVSLYRKYDYKIVNGRVKVISKPL